MAYDAPATTEVGETEPLKKFNLAHTAGVGVGVGVSVGVGVGVDERAPYTSNS